MRARCICEADGVVYMQLDWPSMELDARVFNRFIGWSCMCCGLTTATRLSRLVAGFIKGAGGISPVDCPGVENVNLSNLISGHFDYAVKMPEIVELLHL